MGNHGSRKDPRKWGKHGGKAAHALNRVEELRGPSVDSYDKLIAWLAEMAEADNVHLDTSVFVSQLNRVCGVQAKSNNLDAAGNQAAAGTGSNGKLTPNVRQNSASCDSHVSHTSSDLTSRVKNSTRSEDLLDPRSAWRSGFNSRQTTFSDECGEEDSEVRNASMESLYSSSDRDSELGSMAPSEMAAKRSGKNHGLFASNSPDVGRLLGKLAGLENCSAMSFSCSTGNLDLLDTYDDSVSKRKASLPDGRRSVSLLNLCHREPIVPCGIIPRVVLTSGDDVIRTEHAQTAVATPSGNKQTQGGATAPPVTKPRQQQARFQRMFSIHSESHANIAMASSSVPPVLSITTPESKDIPLPAAAAAAAASFLDDALLDGNIADILFSVEALWPKK